MSVQFKGYVGPYLRTTWGEKDRLVERYCCANEECERFQIAADPMRETFCAKCGCRLVAIPVNVPGKDAPPPDLVFKGLRLIHDNGEDRREHLWVPDDMRWFEPTIKQVFKPGTEVEWSREFDFTGEDGRIAFPVYQLTVAQSCTAFAGVFRPEIEKMKAGYDNVELLFGLLTWVS